MSAGFNINDNSLNNFVYDDWNKYMKEKEKIDSCFDEYIYYVNLK